MDLRDLIGLVMANLRRTRGRVVTTALGVVVGTASVVVLVSLGVGLEHQALESLGAGVSEIHVMSTLPMATRPVPEVPTPARVEALPGVAWAVGFEPLRASVDAQMGQACLPAVRVVGVDPERVENLGFTCVAGDLDLARGRAILGARLAQRLAEQDGDVPAEALAGRGLNLYVARYGGDGSTMEKLLRVEVAGVLAPMGAGYDFGLYIAEREALAINGWLTSSRRDPARQGYPEMLVKVDDVRRADAVERGLAAMGLSFHSQRGQAESVGAYFEELQLQLGGVAGISLLVAAFSIANTMLTAIFERTREIGLMKALGARDRDVMAVFLGEAGTIGVLGGAGGVALGMAVNGMINLFGGQVDLLKQLYGGATGLHAFTPLWLPPAAAAFAALVGVLSGIYPARRAARLAPLAALKAR